MQLPLVPLRPRPLASFTLRVTIAFAIVHAFHAGGLSTAVSAAPPALAASAVPPASFDDDFDGAAIDSALWSPGSLFAPVVGSLDPGVSLGLSGGQLRITTLAEAADPVYNGLLSNPSLDFRGGSISALVVPARGGAFTWLGLSRDADFLLVVVDSESVYLQQLSAGAGGFTTIPYDPLAHVFFRMRHDLNSDTIFFEASADGATWQPLHSEPRLVALDSMQVELVAGTYQSQAEPGDAFFDSVHYVPNAAPVLSVLPAQASIVGQPVALQLFATDAEGNAITFSATGLPAGLELDPATGAITGSPTAIGANSVTFSATDSVASHSFTIGWEIKADTGFPAEWNVGSIGAPPIPGSATFANGVSTLTGSGLMAFASDSFQSAWIPFVGDGEAVVRVTSQTGGRSARAGIVFRESAQPNARAAGIYLTPGAGFVFQTRLVTGGGTAVKTAPSFAAPDNWLRLVRSGDTFTAFRSADGFAWTQVGTARLIMTRAITFGLAVSSQSNTASSTATFDNLDLAPTTLPAPWVGGDINLPARADIERFDGSAFTIAGGGAGFTGTIDSGHFTSQTLTGNGEIIARVAAQSATYAWAKAGVMLRESSDPRSRMVLLSLTQSNGIYLQTRANQAAAATTIAAPRGDTWLRLVRSGSTITGFRSADGVAWTPIGTSTVNFGETISIGLAVTASSANLLSTAVFDNVTVIPEVLTF